MKGVTMIRKMVIVSLLLGMTVWAAQDSVDAVEKSRLGKIEEAVSKVLSKAGINFGGEFRSQFLLSRVKGDGVNKAARNRRT
jgi:tRNA U38,U39,U40 pseudouridine synthase TruA